MSDKTKKNQIKKPQRTQIQDISLEGHELTDAEIRLIYGGAATTGGSCTEPGACDT